MLLAHTWLTRPWGEKSKNDMINGWNAVRYKDWFSAKTFKVNAFLLSHIDGNFYGRKMQDSVKAELGMLIVGWLVS